MFDTSKHAILARRYEASNERNMFKAIKELQQVEKEAAENPQPSPTYRNVPLGSICQARRSRPLPTRRRRSRPRRKSSRINPFADSSRSYFQARRAEIAEERARRDEREHSASQVPLMN